VLVVVQAIGITWSEETVFKSCQSVGVNYGSFDPYCLVVVKEQKALNSRLSINIVNKASLDGGGDYGLHLNYFEDYYNEYVKNKEFEKAKVEWGDEGVRLEVPMYVWTESGGNFDNKYQLFIPKKSFIGGR
jgi:hypothetical protein